jgi:hypothetical protein
MSIDLGLTNIKNIAGIKEVRGGDNLIWQNYILVNSLDFVNSTAHSIRMSWTGTSSFTYYSIRRNGVEVYRGEDTEFIDHLLFPNNTYSYSVYGHVSEGGFAYGTDITYAFSTVDLYNITYSETTSYMNAISVLNDDTLYYTGTPQEITGKRMWQAFNEVVHYFKVNNIWDKFIFWNPVWGDTWTKRGVNAHDPTDHDLIFENQANWTANSLGVTGNGSNTQGYWTDLDKGTARLSLKDYPNNLDRGLAISITDNDNTNLEVEMGEARTTGKACFLAGNVPLYGGALVGMGEDSDSPPYIGIPVTTSIGILSGHGSGMYKWGYKNGKLEQYLRSRRRDLQNSISHHLAFGCITEVGNETYFSTKTIANPCCTIGFQTYIEGLALHKGMEMWESFIYRRVWSAPTSDLEPTITQPAGNNELLSPNDITTADWYTIDVTPEQFADYMKITEVPGSSPHYIYAQSAPQATHICEFHPEMSTADNIYFSFGQQSNIRYGVRINLDTMEVTDLGNNGNSLFDITLEKQMDGWFKIMMKCSSTSGLHDNFTISFSEVDRTSQGKTIVFRNPIAIYNQ